MQNETNKNMTTYTKEQINEFRKIELLKDIELNKTRVHTKVTHRSFIAGSMKTRLERIEQLSNETK
jgi:hypothetical protein